MFNKILEFRNWVGTQYYIRISSPMKPILNLTTYNVLKFSIHFYKTIGALK